MIFREVNNKSRAKKKKVVVRYASRITQSSVLFQDFFGYRANFAFEIAKIFSAISLKTNYFLIMLGFKVQNTTWSENDWRAAQKSQVGCRLDIPDIGKHLVKMVP